MRAHPLFLVLAATLSAGCALPSRDNPDDPQNAPAARLQIVARAPGDPCTPAVPSTGWEPVAAVRRGRCVALDARASAAKRGTIARFDFSFQASDGTLTPLDPTQVLVTPTAGLAVLAQSYVATLSTSAVSAFHVTVTDSENGHAGASAGFAIGNSPPIARGDADRRYVPGGPVWAPVSSYDVVFDGSGSSDPDGDLIQQYCWDFADGTQCAAPGTTSIVRSIPSTRGLTLAHLRVFDGSDWSLPVAVVVEVDDGNVWSRDENTTHLRSRLDAQRTQLPVPAPTAGATLGPVSWTDVPARRRRVLIDWAQGSGATAEIFVTSTTGAAVSPRLATDVLSFFPGGVAVDPVTSSVWTVANSKAERFDFAADSNSLSHAATVPLTPMVSQQASVDGAGRLWFVGALGYPRFEVSSVENGAEIQAVVSSNIGFSGVLARPDSTEAWALENPLDFTVGTNGELVAYESAAAAPVRIVQLPGPHWDSFAWVDHDHLWLSRTDDGIRLVDLTKLGPVNSEIDLEVATIAFAPVLASVRGMVVDSERGSVWADTLLGYLRVTPEGDVLQLPSDGNVVSFVADDGYLWFGNAGSTLTLETRGHAPNGDGIVAETESVGDVFAGVEPDQWEGGLWIRTNTALYLYGEDGRRRRREDHVNIGGVVRPIPSGERIAVSPDGRLLWSYDDPGLANVVRVYDVRTSPPTALSGNLVPGAGAITKQIIAIGPAAAPVPGQPAFTWFAFGDGTGGTTISTVDTAGNQSTRLVYSGAGTEKPIYFESVGMSPATNSLCVVSYDQISGPFNMYVRYVPPTGSASLVTTVALPSGAIVRATGATNDAGGDLCWAFYSTPSATACPGGGFASPTLSMRAWRTNGALIRSKDFPLMDMASQFPFFAATSTDAWMSVTQQFSACGNAQTRMIHQDFAANLTTNFLAHDAAGLAHP